MTFETTKDPVDIEDYSILWSAMLATSTPGDIIKTSAWSTSTVPNNDDLVLENWTDAFLLPGSEFFLLPDGVSHLLLPSEYITSAGTVTTVWVTGGDKVGTTHRLVNKVETVAGRTWKRTIEVTMEKK
jgi:hypothetical protein